MGMTTSSSTSRRRNIIITHFFGVWGYLCCLCLWVWMTIVYAYPLIKNDQRFCSLLGPSQPSPASQTTMDISLPQPLTVALSIIICVIVISLTVYILIMLPRTIGKTGAAVVKKTTDAIVPLAVGHKKITKKQRRRINSRVTAGIKLFACTAPVIALYVFPGSAPLADIVIRTVAVFCGGMAAFNFLLQYSAARMLHVPDEKLW